MNLFSSSLFIFKKKQQKSGKLFHFSFVVWQQLLAVTRKWGDRDASTFGLNPATGWARIPPVTPDATNKLFVLKLTSMGLFVWRKLKNKTNRNWVKLNGCVQIGEVTFWLVTQVSPVDNSQYFPFGKGFLFPPLVASGKRTNRPPRRWRLPSHACKTQRGTAIESPPTRQSGDGSLHGGHLHHLEASASSVGTVLLIYGCTLSITVHKYVEDAASWEVPCEVCTPDLDVSKAPLLISP